MTSKEPRPLPTHTPGPWIVKYDDQYDHVFTKATPHRRIANVFGGIRGESDFDLENQANAALIARAPELLERVAELEQALTIDGIEDLIKTRDRLQSELAHSDCYLRKSEEFCAKADAEIARLRELLRECFDCIEKTDHWYQSDVKEKLKKELGK
jgi:hypothetical protein